MDKYLFQYCQKIVVFSEDLTKVLLAKRKGEKDYDGVFSFIGGKMEISDKDIVEALRREKNEEAGGDFKIRILPLYTINATFQKSDGSHMILPHYLAIYDKGEINLSDEYSEYRWVALSGLDAFEPKIPNIADIARKLVRLKAVTKPDDFVTI